MPQQDRVKEIINKGREEQWPYPKLFESLKEAGILSYEVNVEDHEILYHGTETSFLEKLPGFNTLEISKTFNSKGVQETIQANQTGKTTYHQFLEGIAKNGVEKYIVEMNARKIHYVGISGEEHIENVPTFS